VKTGLIFEHAARCVFAALAAPEGLPSIRGRERRAVLEDGTPGRLLSCFLRDPLMKGGRLYAYSHDI